MPTRITQIERPKNKPSALKDIAENGDQPDSSHPESVTSDIGTVPTVFKVEGTLHLSSEMFATLEGPGFEIKAITPEQQPIAEGFPTVWSWNVEAKESGEQELQATLYAIVGEKAARMRIASYTQKISVSVRER